MESYPVGVDPNNGIYPLAYAVVESENRQKGVIPAIAETFPSAKHSYRKWEFSGIPCKHAVAAIWNMASNGLETAIPEYYCNPCHWLSTSKEMYKFKINPINGWSQSRGCTSKHTGLVGGGSQDGGVGGLKDGGGGGSQHGVGKSDDAKKMFGKYRRLVLKGHPYTRYFDDNMVATKVFSQKVENERAYMKSCCMGGRRIRISDRLVTDKVLLNAMGGRRIRISDRLVTDKVLLNAMGGRRMHINDRLVTAL
ncbi:mutator type transposase [Tanacetum coccineum]